MHASVRLAPFAAIALLAACAGTSLKPTPPTVVIPANLAAPANETLARTLWAEGVQIYECRAGSAGAAPAWVFVAPDASLRTADGVLVGHHYAGPTWEAGDGSKVVGAVKAKVDSPDAGAIPWLLLATHSTGKPGLFANVTSIQRVATAGGAMPATGCDSTSVGQQAKVPYKAQYTQYIPTL